MRVLLVEDEAGLGSAVREHIAAEGHAVDWLTTLAAAEDAIAGTAYELVLLDLHLPDGRGLEMLRRMRRRGETTPVIIVTARDQISDRIEGLNSGADDYLVKPFDLDELTARLNAVARRYAGNPNPLVAAGDVVIDSARRRVEIAGERVELTAREWTVLDQLLRNPRAIVSKAQIEDALYAFGAEVESNTVEVYVSRLRKKLKRELIATVRGIGYRLVLP